MLSALFPRFFPRPARFALLVLALTAMASSGWAATLTVTSSADDTVTPGTLRAAIAAAGAGDTIRFAPAITSITLTAGELVIGKNLTVQGPARTTLTVSANNASRVFHISGGSVAISNLTITQGFTAASGGDILVDSGNLTLSNCTVSAGSAGNGGGLYVTAPGALTLSGCFFNGNTAGVSGGGLSAAGKAIVSNCYLENNTVGGGTDTTVATLSGGGLAVLTGGNVSLVNSVIYGNAVLPNAASGNLVVGGGVAVSGGGLLAVNQCSIEGNNAAEGGGIAALDAGNQPSHLTMIVTASTINSNTAAGDPATGSGGGGLFVGSSGSAILVNDTINGNTATNGNGGGADNLGAVSLTSCTVSANTVQNGYGGGLTNSGVSAASETLQATIVAGNNNAVTTGPNLTGAFTSAGSNLLGDAAGASGFSATLHDQIGTAGAPIDPLLGPLQFNGGPTSTQAIAVTSPALNADYSAKPPATDQRGVARPLGIRADIGAFEAPSPPAMPTNLVAKPGFNQVTLTWTGTADAVSYNVYRGTAPGKEDLTAPPLNVKPIQGMRYVDAGLTNGTPLYYVVVGVNPAGFSLPSNEASATPLDNRIHGSVLTWGDNQSGELGNGTFTRSLLAGPIAAPPAATGSSPVVLNNIVQVSGGSNYSLALTADGSVYAWGDNTYGQLGNGKSAGSGQTNSSAVPTLVQDVSGTPLTNIIAISAGQDHALALVSNGTVLSWGRNQYGQLGNGTTFFRGDNPYATSVELPNFQVLTGVIAIAAGAYHSLAVISGGTVMAWGYNSSGQLGNATSGPGNDSAYPVQVSGLINAVSVSAGQYFSLALAADGSVSAWGYNNDGELGQGNFGTSAGQNTPVLVQLTDPTTQASQTVTQIAAGNAHTLALTAAGSVYAWGSDSSDQLGDNGFGSSYNANPTPVGTVSALSLGAGAAFSLAVQSDNTLLTWGADSSGQLGTNTVASSQQPAPALTSFGSPLSYIYGAAGGSLHSLAIQNLPPVAARAAYVISVNTLRDVPAPGLNANATDAENDGPLTATLVGQASHGTAMVYPSGRFTYKPNTGYQGADSFTYKVNDGLADSAPATVTLTIVPTVLQSITVTPQAVSLAESGTQQFTATGNYNDGSVSDLTSQVTWSSSDTTIVTVSNVPASQGLATAAARNAGQAAVTATLGSLSGTATVTVTRSLQSISISPLTPTLAKGLTQQFTATANFSDGFTQDVTARVLFSTSDKTVAVFSGAYGEQNPLTAIGRGMATVYAYDPVSAKSAGATLTVTAAAQTGITVTPANATLPRGQTRQYTATATYTDSTQVNITQTVLWSTINQNVATIDSAGIAAGIGVGQTTITATDPVSKLSGSTGVSVNDPNLTPHSHFLYTLTGGAVSLWDVDTAGRVIEHLYGPYADYHATALATGADGVTHILWNKADGTVALWAVASDGAFTSRSYGPYTDGPKQTVWTATAVSIGPDNAPHILWNNPDGKVAFWNVNPQTGTFVSSTYGPYAGYSATALATGTDGISHILWNSTGGTVSLWAVDTAGAITHVEYGPFSGYSATGVSVGTDGTIHILWNNVSGQVSFWNLGGSGAITHTEYGPYPNWAAVACATGPDNVSHILWGRTDHTVSFWDVNSTNGSFNYHVYGPLSGYTPTALSAGP